MRFSPVILSLSISVLTVTAASAGPKKSGLTVPVVYAGGTLPLAPGKIKAIVAEDRLMLFHGNQQISVPMESITAISSGTDVRRRFGAGVLGVVPLVHLDKSET